MGGATRPSGADPAVAGDPSERWASVDARGGAPGSPRSDRTGGGVAPIRKAKSFGLPFLVGLGSTQHEHQAAVVFGDVFDVEADELTAAQCSGEADEHEGPVADVDCTVAQRSDKSVDDLRAGGPYFLRCDTVDSTDARPYCSDLGRPGRWLFVPGGLVGDADRSETTA